jgi:hypothetical protein
MGEWMDPIDAFNKLWQAATKLKALSDKVKEADVRMAIADVIMDAADLKVKIAELTEENLRLKSQLGQAKQGEDIKSKLVHRDSAYYLPKDGGGFDGPFCTRCFDAEAKLVRVKPSSGEWTQMYKVHCPNCNTYQ